MKKYSSFAALKRQSSSTNVKKQSSVPFLRRIFNREPPPPPPPRVDATPTLQALIGVRDHHRAICRRLRELGNNSFAAAAKFEEQAEFLYSIAQYDGAKELWVKAEMGYIQVKEYELQRYRHESTANAAGDIWKDGVGLVQKGSEQEIDWWIKWWTGNGFLKEWMDAEKKKEEEARKKRELERAMYENFEADREELIREFY